MDPIIGVELPDPGDQVILLQIILELDLLRVDPDLLGRSRLHSDVELAGGIRPGEDGGEPGNGTASSGEVRDPLLEIGSDRSRDFLT